MKREKNSETGIEDLVRAEKLGLLFHYSVPGAAFSAVGAGLLAMALWSVQSHKILVVWVLAVCLTALGRLAFYGVYRLKSRTPKEIVIWEKPYYWILIISALVWGMGGVIVMPEDSLFHQAVAVSFIMGLVAGAISAYSIDRWLTLLAAAMLMLPGGIWLFLQNTTESVSMGSAVLLFFGWLTISTKAHAKTMHRNLVLKHELQRSTDRAEYLARTDVLTGLYNRRAFYEQLIRLSDYSASHNEPLSVVMMDVDHFKAINDTYGHAAGDKVLTRVGQIFQNSIQTLDVCSRLGGEEFGVLAPKYNLQDAQVLAEKLRREIEEVRFETDGKQYSVTASFGVASGLGNAEEILKQADKAMYKAKENGRNRVAVLAVKSVQTKPEIKPEIV